MRYDILVIGAGTAGMVCAITAAQKGAKVCVIEKDNKIGGTLHWTGGHMSAGGTKRQKALGIKDSPQKHFEDIVRINGGTGDLKLTKMAVEEAPRTIDWLEDLGFEFAPECPRIIYGHVPYTEARTHYGTEKGYSILKVLTPLWDEAVETGNIEIYLEHSMVDIVKENGQYNTVKSIYNGTEKVFKGKHIVLTTGGYGSAPDYFNQKHPDVPMVSSAYPFANAEGHLISERLGGVFRFAETHLPSLGGLEFEPNSGRCDFNEAWAMVLTSVYRQPREIYVNINGERFIREDEENADTRERIVVKQPEWKFWLIFDEAALQERGKNGMENPIIIGWDTDKIKAEAQLERAIYRANTIEILANKTKLPIDKLQATIARFNEAIEEGIDNDFGRIYLKNKISEPPYYAILVHASILVTFGGMKVNEHLQLLNQDGEILPGIYGAGEFLGLGATSGGAFCSGMSITPALSFGRILGRNLADQI